MASAIEWQPSPNFGPRLTGPTDILLLHYTGMDSPERALKWLRDPESGVSAHYFVFEDGRIAQLVDEADRAWHAGRSCWAGETDVNSRSIGIEIANPGHEYGYRAFPDVQIDAVIELCQGILSRWPIPQNRIVAHSDIAPDRKEDPGELFPWKELAAAGVGLWPDLPPAERVAPIGLRLGDRGEQVTSLQRNLSEIGYRIDLSGRFDATTEAVVRAFQRRWRPATVTGQGDLATALWAEAVAKLANA
jgi:N-acetylmuramoyl-L-alanine amidase